MIRLSLIIATYNRSAALVEALRSVVRQDFPAAEWECIVVNNNSQDDTLARFEAFATEHPAINLRIVTETRQGLSHARNRGIDESRGEYIAIIDDDERINEQFISSYVALFDAYPDAASAGGPIIPEYPAGCPAWMSSYTERPIANPIDLGRKIRPFPKGRIPGGGNMALRRSTVQRYGAFDPSLGADRRATDRRRRERSFSAVGRRRRTLLLCSDSNYVAYHSAAKDLPGILRIIMLPGRTHPTPAGRNEGANRASVIGRSRQVGCDTPVGSRLPVAVLRPQSPLSAPDAEANHTGNIGSKTVRRRLGDLPVKIPAASLQTGIRKFCCTNMFSGCRTCRTEPYIRIRYSSETGGGTPDHSSDECPAEEHLYLCFPCGGGVPGLCPGRGCLWGFGAFL